MKTLFIENLADTVLNSNWDKFVESQLQGTIFQSPHYFKLFENQASFRPVAVLLTDNAQNVTGVLSGIIQYQLPGPLKHLTSRCIVIGGPIVQNNDPGLLKQILEAFDSFVSAKAIYTQFRNLFDMSFAASNFADLNYTYEDHLNILVDLTKPEDYLWHQVDAQKRQQFRRSIREGLTFKPITTQPDLIRSYKLLCKLYSIIKLPIFPFSVFKNAFFELAPKGLAVFFGAYLQEELVGTMYTLCYNGRVSDYFAGSNKMHYNKYPNSFIPWQVMLWGKSNGMTLFDWGGAGKPGVPYGVRDYKEKFGGQLVNFGRFEKIHKPLIFQIAKNIFQLWQSIKR